MATIDPNVIMIDVTGPHRTGLETQTLADRGRLTRLHDNNGDLRFREVA